MAQFSPQGPQQGQGILAGAPQKAKPLSLYFVVLTWNSAAYIQNCLQAIFAMRQFNSRVCVIENGSEDGTAGMIDAFAQANGLQGRIEVILLPENQGTTKPRNMGLKKVPPGTDYICILDSDTAVEAEAFEAMSALLHSRPEVGMAGPLLRGEGGVQMSGRNFPVITAKLLKALPFAAAQKRGAALEAPQNAQKDACYEVDYLMSACWLMRPQLLQTAGYLDEAIFYAPEDVEYCIRVWKAGYKILYLPTAGIYHAWQRLSKKKMFSRLNFLHLKGLLHMYAKHRFLFSAKRLYKTMPLHYRSKPE